jgi:hypothetical protein
MDSESTIGELPEMVLVHQRYSMILLTQISPLMAMRPALDITLNLHEVQAQANIRALSVCNDDGA